jgi:hypothetical protein
VIVLPVPPVLLSNTSVFWVEMNYIILQNSLFPGLSSRYTISISHFFRRNCLLKHSMERKTEVTWRRERKRKQLPDDLKEKRKYWNFARETTRLRALCNSVWKRLCKKTDVCKTVIVSVDLYECEMWSVNKLAAFENRRWGEYWCLWERGNQGEEEIRAMRILMFHRVIDSFWCWCN